MLMTFQHFEFHWGRCNEILEVISIYVRLKKKLYIDDLESVSG
jgi:hypothetical protein